MENCIYTYLHFIEICVFSFEIFTANRDLENMSKKIKCFASGIAQACVICLNWGSFHLGKFKVDANSKFKFDV